MSIAEVLLVIVTIGPAHAETIEVPLDRLDNRENKIYEAACHEGNYAMTSILAGARLNEQ